MNREQHQRILSRVGRQLQIAGALYVDAETEEAFIFLIPGEGADSQPTTLNPTPDQWEDLLRQSDLVHVEALVEGEDGKLKRAVVRKCERQVSQVVSWQVFRRDGFRCCYCGTDNVPLTVDHLVTWESGGPSTEDNLLSSCRRCNNARGETPFGEWIKSTLFLKLSRGLSPSEQFKLQAIVPRLDRIQVRPVKSEKPRKRR